MKVKEEREEAGLKLNIQKTKIMASGPITSWQIDGDTMETVTDFFLVSKITSYGDFSHEIKTIALWKKSYDQPRQHIKKQRHYFTDKVPSSQSYIFSSSHVWTWEVDHKEKLSTEELMLLKCGVGEDSWESLDSKEIQPVNRKGNQSGIFIGSWSSYTLPTWCKELTHWQRPWCWERLKAGGEGENRGQDSWMASRTQWTWVWTSSRSWWRTGKPEVLQSMGSQRVNWTKLILTSVRWYLIVVLICISLIISGFLAYLGNTSFLILCRWFIFKIKGLCQLSVKSTGTIFPITFTHFMSLHHI